MKRNKMSPKAGLWAGLLGAPVLVVAAVVVLGVASAPAGPQRVAANAEAALVSSPASMRQDVEAVMDYWTSQRMAEAQGYPIPLLSETAHEQHEQVAVPESAGSPGELEGWAPLALRSAGATLPAAGAVLDETPMHEAYHAAIPFTRWSLIGAYVKYPNSTVAKMFFSQDHDGNGTLSNFVCSTGTIAVDAVWTAAHCLNNALNGAGANGGWSTNILVCPSYDNGVNSQRGCWGADAPWILTAYLQNGGGNQDMGILNTSNNGTVLTGQIGTRTGWLGARWNWPRNQHWVALGYPAGSPFAGGKLIMAASSFGYTDDWTPGISSNAMGSDLTGGSSGGPWVMQYGLPGQVAGLGGNYLNGQNTWRHTAVPNEMASPHFDCRFVALYNAGTGSSITC